MIFSPLPTAFPKLQALVQSMDAVVVSKPPPIEAIGRRLRTAYARASTDHYRGLSAGEVRKLPYAYWLPPEPPLHEVHAPLVQHYWASALPEAMQSGTRRAKRWLTPLFFTYCEAFDAGDDWFKEFAERLASTVLRSEGAFADRLRGLQREVSFFSPTLAPRRLAEALMSHPKRLDEAFEAYLLWPKFTDTPLGDAVFEAALDLDSKRHSEWAVIARILDWEKRLGARVVKTANRVKFADALLRPWLRRPVPDTIKASLIEFFVRVYGDPRMEGTRQFQWHGVSPQAISVLMGWLAGDTLRGFMGVLKHTADEIWKYRQKFWMAYYNAGHIQEAWLALGYQAAWFAKKLQADERGLGFGTLDSGATPNQSVLLLKIGQLVFTEWSHNGSMRAYMEGGEDTPSLYGSSYHGGDLRAAISMDFHDGMNLNPQLAHMNSAGGTWQRKARDFIRQHTGIHIDDREIL